MTEVLIDRNQSQCDYGYYTSEKFLKILDNHQEFIKTTTQKCQLFNQQNEYNMSQHI